MGEHPDVEQHHQNDEHRQPRPSDGTEGLALLNKDGRQCDEQYRITRIGHGDAPGVAGDVEDGVALLVVVALVETVMLVSQDVVHRDDDVLLGFAIGELKVAHIVLRFLAVGIFHNLKVVQGEAEGQRFFCYLSFVLDKEMAVGAVGFEFHPAVLSREHGEQRAQEDEQDGQMQGADRKLFPHTAFHIHNDDENG